MSQFVKNQLKDLLMLRQYTRNILTLHWKRKENKVQYDNNQMLFTLCYGFMCGILFMW